MQVEGKYLPIDVVGDADGTALAAAGGSGESKDGLSDDDEKGAGADGKAASECDARCRLVLALCGR